MVYLVFGALRPREPAASPDTALPHETAASTDGAPDELAATARRRRREQATMAGLATLAIASLVFDLNVGFVAVLIALALAAVALGSQNGAEDRVSWSTVLLVCGIITHIDVMQKLGTIDWARRRSRLFANPLLAALALCHVARIVSAFASSTALLGILVPLAVPFMAQGAVGAVGMVSAIAVATTIVDTSPFSTNGALVVANAPPERRRPALLRQPLRYSAALVAAGPLLAWLVFVVRPRTAAPERAWQAELVLGDVRQDQVGRDRRHPDEPRLAELRFRRRTRGEASRHGSAGVGRLPRGLRGQQLGHVGLGARASCAS